MELNQYAIILAHLDPTIGSEIKKTRPCVIISPDEMNRHLNTIIVAPMTTSLHKYPTRIPVKHDNKKGMIAIDQIRTIDKSRVIKMFNRLTNAEIEHCKSIIQETFVD